VYRGPPEVYRGPCMKITPWNQGIISTLVCFVIFATCLFGEWRCIYNHRIERPAATTRKDVATKRMRTRSTFSHWWHQSAGHKWSLIEPVWYLSILEARLMRPIIATWWRYNSSCRHTSEVGRILHPSARQCNGTQGSR